MIDRPKSISQQIRGLLWERMHRGEFDATGKLPSEEQLAEEYSVSRATIRTALTQLASEGLINRKHGEGTYINRPLIQVTTRLDTVWEFTQLIHDSNREPSIKLLSMEHHLASEHEAAMLDISFHAQVLSLSRIFLADRHPVILSTNILPVEILKRELPPDAANLPILTIFEQYCQQTFGYALADISAVNVDPYLGKALKKDIGTALLRLDEVFYNDAGQPLMLGMNYYDDKALRLRILRSKI